MLAPASQTVGFRVEGAVQKVAVATERRSARCVGLLSRALARAQGRRYVGPEDDDTCSCDSFCCCSCCCDDAFSDCGSDWEAGAAIVSGDGGESVASVASPTKPIAIPARDDSRRQRYWAAVRARLQQDAAMHAAAAAAAAPMQARGAATAHQPTAHVQGSTTRTQPAGALRAAPGPRETQKITIA